MLDCTLHSWNQGMVQWRKVSANPDPKIRLIISWHHLLRLLSVDGKLRWVWSIGELILTGKRKYLEKNLCQCHFSLICIAREEYSVAVSIFLFTCMANNWVLHKLRSSVVEGLFLGLYTVWVMFSNTAEEHTASVFRLPASGVYECWSGWEEGNLSVNVWKLEKIRPVRSLEEGEG